MLAYLSRILKAEGYHLRKYTPWVLKCMLVRGDGVICTGISEPMPVAATFFTPDVTGHSLSSFAAIDTMVRCPGSALYMQNSYLHASYECIA